MILLRYILVVFLMLGSIQASSQVSFIDFELTSTPEKPGEYFDVSFRLSGSSPLAQITVEFYMKVQGVTYLLANRNVLLRQSGFIWIPPIGDLTQRIQLPFALQEFECFPSGTHEVYGRVIGTTNPSLSEYFTIDTRPDLRVEGRIESGSTLTPGFEFNTILNLINDGSCPASNFFVFIDAQCVSNCTSGNDYKEIGPIIVNSLPQNFSAETNPITLQMPSDIFPGTWQLRARVDASNNVSDNNRISELNENNNSDVVATFTVIDDVRISSFSPQSGLPGTIIRLNGQRLNQVTSVTIGGVNAEFDDISPNELIIAVPPAGVSGSQFIQLNSATRTVTSQFPFTFQESTTHFGEDFEDTFTRKPLLFSNGDGSNTWFRFNAGYQSNFSYVMPNFGYNAPGEFDILIFPKLDIQDYDSLFLNFDVAHAIRDFTNMDNLQIYVDIDGTGLQLALNMPGNTIATKIQATSFIPAVNGDWLPRRINFASVLQAATETIQIYIVNQNNNGNNIFLDNVRIENYPAVWVGSDNANIADASQWSSDPTISSVLTIPGDANLFPSLSSTLNIANLVIEDGAEFSIASSGVLNLSESLVVSGELTNQGTLVVPDITASNSEIINSGSIEITGNITGGLSISDAGSVTLNGSTQQNVAFSSVQNLAIDNLNGVSMNSPMMANGTLTLQSGQISLNDHDLRISALGNIDQQSDNSYIITNGTGSIIQFVNESFRFYPAGSESSYSPLGLQNVGPESDFFSVNVWDHRLQEGVSGDTIRNASLPLTYNIQEETLGGSVTHLTAYWDSSIEPFDFNSKVYIDHYESGRWDTVSAVTPLTAANGLRYVVRDSVLSFSPFGVSSGEDEALPVVWKGFTVRQTDEGNILEWETFIEISNSHFDIERSFDGEAFHKISTIGGSGNTDEIRNYDFIDSQQGIICKYDCYYRLKQVDFDGQYDFSVIQFVTAKSGCQEFDESQVKISPNPSPNGVFMIHGMNYFEGIQIEIFNSAGDRVPFITSGSDEIEIVNPRPGFYVVRGLNSRGESVFSQKVLVK